MYIAVVETYLHFGRYPDTYSKGEKANLRRKCHNNNIIISLATEYSTTRVQGAVKGKKSRLEDENWRIYVRTDEEKQSLVMMELKVTLLV